jgi:hypothetical protein
MSGDPPAQNFSVSLHDKLSVSDTYDGIVQALENIRPHVDEEGRGLIDKIIAIARNPSSYTLENVRAVIKDGSSLIVLTTGIDKFAHVVGPDIVTLFTKLAELTQWLIK